MRQNATSRITRRKTPPISPRDVIALVGALSLVIAMQAGVFAAPMTDKPSDPHAALIENQIAYLNHLAKARTSMAKGNADAAIVEIEHALALELPDTTLPNINLATSHAAAHYEMACARALQGDADAAKRSLRQAAKNGFRDTALVTTDPRLSLVASPEGFAKIVERFPAENPTDSFASKTVADPQFGMSLLQARKGNFPKLGERAPDFELSRLAGSGGTGGTDKLRLSSLVGDKPIVLVFGSFT